MKSFSHAISCPSLVKEGKQKVAVMCGVMCGSKLKGQLEQKGFFHIFILND